jgi:hypothetical protein
MNMTSFFINWMRPSSVFGNPSFRADAIARIINTSRTYIKIINVSLLFIGIRNGTF